MNAAADALAKKRFIALNAIRITGAILVLAGFVLIRGGWTLAGQPTDRWLGVAVVLVGLFDFAVMPRILARRCRPPPEYRSAYDPPPPPTGRTTTEERLEGKR